MLFAVTEWNGRFNNFFTSVQNRRWFDCILWNLSELIQMFFVILTIFRRTRFLSINQADWLVIGDFKSFSTPEPHKYFSLSPSKPKISLTFDD